MVEYLVDQAISALISASVPGLTALAGLQDDEGVSTPYCAVYSRVEAVEGRTAVFQLLTTVELVSISGQDPVAYVNATMTAIDRALTTQPSPLVLASLPLSNFAYGPTWEHIPRTANEVGDRRRNVRELQVYASLS
jgi:hypothetical protein